MDKRTFEEKLLLFGFNVKSFDVQKQKYAQIIAHSAPHLQETLDEEFALFIHLTTIMPEILGNGKLYDYLDMITNNFIIENLEDFSEFAFDGIKASAAKIADNSQVFLPYIRDQNKGTTYYEREINILTDLFSEAIDTNKQIASIIVLYFVLTRFVEQHSIKWVNMYPQFGGITSKADVLSTYAQLYYEGDKIFKRGLSRHKFELSCWLFYENLDRRSLPDIFQSLDAETKQAIEKTEIAKMRSTFLQPKNDVIMQRTPIGDSEEPITISKIDNYSGVEFEAFIGSLFEADGYQVEFTQASNDKGIDIIAKRSGVSIGIQCKRYSSSIGISAVQEVFSGKNFYSLDRALVVTNNKFTKAAKDLADSTGVVLWDRDFLIAKISLL